MKQMKVNGYFLDEQQLLPILENKKYSLIVAGAGSGKTLTMIGKIKYLLEEQICRPDEICAISFTNETVKNFKKNIYQNCNVQIPVFTFHKLALSILQFYKVSFEIAPPNLLQEVIQDFFETGCYQNETLKKITFQLFSFSFFHNEKTWASLLKGKEFQKAKKTISTFLCLMKSNGYTKEDLKLFMQQKKDRKFLLLIYSIYLLYQKRLEENQWIDFDDMLTLASKMVQEKGCPFPFKQIIIDEFQDTSLARFQLIQEIVKDCDASLCVVGDDYQSIYHFSGCDLNLFLNFKEYFPTASIYKLEMTYRNSYELIEVAGRFILKNPSQMKKNLQSPKSRKNPIKIIFYKKKSNILEKIIESIPFEEEILVLGRNHFDLNSYTTHLPFIKKEDHYIEFAKFKQRKIRYLTIHASKGLESDIVILLNVSNDIYGIPSKMKEEKILSFVKKEQPYPFEEERRLFYVALTRTKKDIYLFVPKENPSLFIKELKKEKNIEKRYFNSFL